MKTTVDIADPLLEEAKALAARRGTTLRSVIEEGLREVLANEPSTARAFRLRDASVGGKGLTAGFRDRPWSDVLDAAYGDGGS
jgi:hypothetical protein